MDFVKLQRPKPQPQPTIGKHCWVYRDNFFEIEGVDPREVHIASICLMPRNALGSSPNRWHLPRTIILVPAGQNDLLFLKVLVVNCSRTGEVMG
jgi:hypothetical protein